MEDGDLVFNSHQKRKGPKTGRRALGASSAAASTLEEEELASETLSKKSASDGPPERPNKAVAGWGEEALVRKPRARQLGEGFEAAEDDRLKQKSQDKDEGNDDDDDDIPVIPELEEQQEDDMATKVAAAPNVVVNRVATYRELDNDLLKQAAFMTLDNEIDLKLLTKALSPPEDIIEYDKAWDWDRLFTEVSSDLRTELEMTDDLEEDKAVVNEQ